MDARAFELSILWYENEENMNRKHIRFVKKFFFLHRMTVYRHDTKFLTLHRKLDILSFSKYMLNKV